MAGIPLRSYIREIEQYVERGRNDEAIAHCRHILETYPKYLEAYRLLGKAFLESQRYGDAADIFQRVLSSIPDDFVSHVGMGIVREDEGNLDEAIWHMERAFEIQPANVAIQDELRRLYGRRDGIEPPKIRLTRGALARMYDRGELYQQAIAETRAALVENTERLDLQVLLAEIYNKTGQSVEAANIANSLLRNLPFCLIANLIMTIVLSATERDQEAQVFQQRLNQLDPYTAFINPKNPTAASVPDPAIKIEKLEWKPEQIAGGLEEQPLWATSLGVELGELAPGKKEALPEWLSEVSTEATSETAKSETQPSVPAFSLDITEETPTPGQQTPPSFPSDIPAPKEEYPEWMQSGGWEPSTKQVEETEASVESTVDEGGKNASTDASELAAAEIPDWLRAMAPIPGPEEVTEKEEDVLPWLDELFKTSGIITTSDQIEIGLEPQIPQEGIERPDWMTTGERVSAPDTGDKAHDQPPDWLEEEPELPEGIKEPATTPSSEETAEAIPTEAAISEDELPTWLFEEVTPTEATTVEERATALEEEIPTWIFEEKSSTTEVTPEQTEVELPSEEQPEWSPEGEVLPTEMISPEVEVTLQTDELPDWLREEVAGSSDIPATTVEPVSSVQEIPDWLLEGEGLQDEILSSEEVTIQAEEASTETEAPQIGKPVEEVPAWSAEEKLFAETAAGEEALSISLEEEIPNWLKETGKAEGAEIPEWLLEEEAPSAESKPSLIGMASQEDTSKIPAESIQEIEEEPIPISDTQPTKIAISEEAVTPLPEGVELPSPAVISEVPSQEMAPHEEVESAFVWLESMTVKQDTEESLLMKSAQPSQPLEERVEQIQEQEVRPEEAGGMPEIELQPESVVPEGIESSVHEPAMLTTEPSAAITEEEAAFAWLEGLAVKQGAEEALLLKPEERLETPPEWIQQTIEEEIPSKAEAKEVIAEEIDKKILAPEVTAVEEMEEIPSGKPEAEITEEVTSVTVSVEEISPPSEVEIQPEGEPLELEYLETSTEEESVTPISMEPAITAEVEPEMAGISESAEEVLEIPEWLSETKSEAQVEAEWEQAPAMMYDLNQASLVELEKLPGIGFIMAQRIIEFRETHDRFTSVDDLLQVDEFNSITLEEIRDHVYVEPTIETPSTTPIEEMISKLGIGEITPEFVEAQKVLAQGNLEQALDVYSQLIHVEQDLPRIIQELEEMTNRYPGEIQVWQNLGDAYLRHNKIQQALDAYMKAEKLLQ